MKKKSKKWIGILVILVIIAILTFFILKVVQIHKLNVEKEQLLREQEELSKEKQDKELELEGVQSPDYLEGQAREDLQLVKPDETLYVLPE